jgi:hypothetical protein
MTVMTEVVAVLRKRRETKMMGYSVEQKLCKMFTSNGRQINLYFLFLCSAVQRKQADPLRGSLLLADYVATLLLEHLKAHVIPQNLYITPCVWPSLSKFCHYFKTSDFRCTDGIERLCKDIVSIQTMSELYLNFPLAITRVKVRL